MAIGLPQKNLYGLYSCRQIHSCNFFELLIMQNGTPPLISNEFQHILAEFSLTIGTIFACARTQILVENPLLIIRWVHFRFICKTNEQQPEMESKWNADNLIIRLHNLWKKWYWNLSTVKAHWIQMNQMRQIKHFLRVRIVEQYALLEQYLCTFYGAVYCCRWTYYGRCIVLYCMSVAHCLHFSANSFDHRINLNDDQIIISKQCLS